MNLYKDKNAKKFSETRNHPWSGWERALGSLQTQKSKTETLNILDLGCGNGRFAKYLSSEYPEASIEYVGVDSSEEMLEIAKKALNSKAEIENKSEIRNQKLETTHKLKSQKSKIKNIQLVKLDLDNNIWNLSRDLSTIGYQLITAFGLTHHLTSFENRKYLVTKSLEYLADNGILVLTFWMFKENEEFLEKHLIEDKGNDDYILSFSGDAKRFCHYSDQSEIDKLIDIKDVEVVDRYRSDGFGNEMNEYVLLKTS